MPKKPKRSVLDVLADIDLAEADRSDRERVETAVANFGRLPTADEEVGDVGDDDLVNPIK